MRRGDCSGFARLAHLMFLGQAARTFAKSTSRFQLSFSRHRALYQPSVKRSLFPMTVGGRGSGRRYSGGRPAATVEDREPSNYHLESGKDVENGHSRGAQPKAIALQALVVNAPASACIVVHSGSCSPARELLVPIHSGWPKPLWCPCSRRIAVAQFGCYHARQVLGSRLTTRQHAMPGRNFFSWQRTSNATSTARGIGKNLLEK